MSEVGQRGAVTPSEGTVAGKLACEAHAPQTRPARPRPSALRLWPYALVVFLGVSRLWVGGYSFGGADGACYVPMIRGLAEGHFLNDYASTHPAKLSLFFPFTAILVRHFPIEYVFLAGYVAASIATSIAVYLLALRMLGARSAALLAVVLLLTGKSLLLQNGLICTATWDPAFAPRVAAMPLALFALWLLMGERPGGAGVLMGIAFMLHPLTGLFAGGIALAYAATSPHRRAALLGFALWMTPPAAAAVLYDMPSPTPILAAPEAWYTAMAERNIALLTVRDLLTACAIAISAFAAGLFLRASGGRPRLLFVSALVASAVFAYEAIAQSAGALAGPSHAKAALMTPPILAVLQPLRVYSVFSVLVAIAAAGVLWRMMEKGPVPGLAGVAAAAALCLGHCMLGLGLVVVAVLASKKGTLPRALAAGLGGVLLFALARHHTLLVYSAGAVAVASAAALVTPARAARPAASLAVVLVLGGVIGSSWAAACAGKVFGQYYRPESSDSAPAVSVAFTGDAALLEAAAWARGHTAPDDVIIVPPTWESFRVAAERPVYGTYKDGTLVYFDAGLADEWLRRMDALHARTPGGWRPDAIDAAYDTTLSEASIRVAAALYPAAYIVRRSGDLPGFELVFAGEHVWVYRIPRNAGESL